jgi:hypothetical protein
MSLADKSAFILADFMERLSVSPIYGHIQERGVS